MDFGTEKSIKEMLERAEQEKQEILQSIQNLLQSRLPQVLEDSKNELEIFTGLAEEFNVNFNPNSDIETPVEEIANKLNTIKIEIEGMIIDQENILNNSSIGDARKVLELVEKAVEELKTKFLASNSKRLIEPYNLKKKLQTEQNYFIDKKKRLEVEIVELEKEIAYLKGKKDAISELVMGTKRKNKKAEPIITEISELERKINEIKSDIESTEEQVETKGAIISELNYKYPKEGAEQESNQEEKTIPSQEEDDKKIQNTTTTQVELEEK